MKKEKAALEEKSFWDRLSPTFRLALKAGFAGGIIAHIYIITNLILNHDSVGGLFSYNENLRNARWSVGTLSSFSTGFQMPVVTLLIAIAMLALTAALTVEILEITNRTAVLLTTGFIVLFPPVACIFSYMFTADAYFIGLFCCALAVYLTRKYRWGWAAAIVLCAISLGSYQAFICYAIGLFLIDCILQLFSDRPLKEIIQTGLKYIGIVLASLVLYYVVLEVLLRITGTQLNDYQNFNQINPLALIEFLQQIPRAYRLFFEYFIHPHYTYGLFAVVQNMLLLLSLGALVYLAATRKLYRDWGRLLTLVAGVALVPLALNFITILSNGGWVHELMLYSFVLLFVLMIKLLDMAFQPKGKKGLVFLGRIAGFAMAAILVWNSFCVCNIVYLRLHVCYENSFATANRIAARVESLEGYSPELPVAFVGEIGQDLYGKKQIFADYNGMTGANDSLLFSGDNYTRTRNFLKDYIGMPMPFASPEQLDVLNNSQAVQDMPSYPAAGSIAIQEGVIVIKLNDGLIR